jgi:hypothetical protein
MKAFSMFLSAKALLLSLALAWQIVVVTTIFATFGTTSAQANQFSAPPPSTPPKSQPPAQASQAAPQSAPAPQQQQPPPPQQPQPKSSEAKRIDLGKFVSTATTPVGLIIAGAIAISFFEQKRTETCGRVRGLIGELRDSNLSEARRRNVVAQINIYKSRLKYVHRGSTLVAITIILFICTNLGSSLGLIWPDFKFFEVVVIAGMLLGMATLASSFVVELIDNAWKQRELQTELADFERLSHDQPPASRPTVARSA